MNLSDIKNIGVAIGVAVAVSVLISTCIVNGSANGDETVRVESEASNSINVTAEDSIKVSPDKAQVIFGVTSEAATAEESQSKNTDNSNAVIAKLKELGVADTSIKTYNYQMYPKYDYTYDENGNATDTLVGYVVSNTIEVNDLDIDKLSTVLTNCVQSGINDITGINYSYSKYDEAYNQVMQSAVEKAKVKANAIAEVSSVTLGEIEDVTEGYQDTSLRYTSSNLAMSAAKEIHDEASYDLAIMPGEIEIEAKVSVSFSIEK